jgi:alkanesulfonate monooxygenase SsuD/methylene tetrahydromethanopterin reductase-like flavin-dependent oxidoreductase (luciferase family)
MGMDRAGVTFASLMALGPDLAVATARQAQDLGYSSFWTAETTGPEAFTILAAAGAAAPGLDLGTGVVALQLRTPMVVAMAGATLAALHPERDILLGVGISSPVVTERWHGVP